MIKLRPKNICFVSLNAYPLLSNKNIEYIGGAEVDQFLLANELPKSSFDVTFITYSDGGDTVECFNNIRIIKAYEREKASSLTLCSKALSLFNAMHKAKADIYFHSAGSSGIVALYCLLNNKKFIYRIPSDRDVDNKLSFPGEKRYRWFLNNMDIKLADRIIAQSEYQKELLKTNFNKKSIVIKNAFPIKPIEVKKPTNRPIVLWVGTIGKVKQPELFLELVISITNADFIMIGGPGNDLEFYNKIENKAKQIPNLRFLGFIPFGEIDVYFNKASVLVNTSMFEGFSNTFIQAWMNCVPVITLNSDPDEVVCKYKLGFHSRTFEQLVQDATEIISNKKLRNQMGINGRRYVEKEHNIKLVLENYVQLIYNLAI